MSKAERLRKLGARYTRLAGLVSREDMCSWLLSLAAEAASAAEALEKAETPEGPRTTVTDSPGQQPAQQQQQIQPKNNDDPKKEWAASAQGVAERELS
jgi:hypothetical protein